jgi:HPt (histidine-containing phosphotransfer) domain-containing protein
MDPAQQLAMTQALDQMWAKFLPQTQERVAILEAAAAAFTAKSLSEDQRGAAHQAAHKLAGVLGTFGLTKGTVLAREAEIVYSREEAPDPASGPRLASIAAELRAIVDSRKPASSPA